MPNTSTSARFCFDPSLLAGRLPDREAIDGVIEDMVEAAGGTATIKNEGDNMIVTVEGDFKPDHLERVILEFADWGMREERYT